MENHINILKKLYRIRYFEETLSKLRYDGKIVGAIHCCVGQEAVEVGAIEALLPDDYVMGSHRSHGIMLAKGINMKALFAEIMGKKEGTNGGKGGSLHVCDYSIGAIGATGIVGSGSPVACGAAFSSKYKGDGRVCAVFLGDGASNEGTFHESLNLASIWKLPIVFVVENNGVAVTTTTEFSVAGEIYRRAFAYDIPGIRVDGQNLEEVYFNMNTAVERARKGNGPTVIEAITYRFHEHAEGKGYARMHNAGYRDEEQVECWINQHDPIELYKQKLISGNLVTLSDVKKIQDKARTEVQAAYEYALNCDYPIKSNAFTNLYL